MNYVWFWHLRMPNANWLYEEKKHLKLTIPNLFRKFYSQVYQGCSTCGESVSQKDIGFQYVINMQGIGMTLTPCVVFFPPLR